MPTTIHNTGITFPDSTTQTTAASAGGQLKTELFTSPGTWTKPASCTQVRVVVIGGGGGSQTPGTPAAPSGGTSSFGPLVTATGGSGGNNNPGGNWMAGPGGASVSSGIALRTGSVQQSSVYHPGPSINLALYYNNIISGRYFTPPTVVSSSPAPQFSAQAYSISAGFVAGQNGGHIGGQGGLGGGGGLAIVSEVPVTGPVAITVGSGGNGSHPSVSGGAVGGVVLVEFVG
jgi:hypothetical protein